jgi:hypothetical protein
MLPAIAAPGEDAQQQAYRSIYESLAVSQSGLPRRKSAAAATQAAPIDDDILAEVLSGL